MVPNVYKEITEDLVAVFLEFISKNKNGLGTIMNKITYIDKSKFYKYNNELDTDVFDKNEYNNALSKQTKHLNNLKLKIDENPEVMLFKFFKYDQILHFRFIINGVDKKNFDRLMKIEYMFEQPILRNKDYKPYINKFFRNMIEEYANMKNSLCYYKHGIFYNNTKIDINDEENIFDKKNKILSILKQDLVLIFLFRKNRIILKKDLYEFLTTYINIFTVVSAVTPKNILEKETIKIWTTGVRYIEVLLDNFKYTNKYINLCLEHKEKINKICPTLRFM